MNSNRKIVAERAAGSAAATWLKSAAAASVLVALVANLCPTAVAQTMPVPGSFDTAFGTAGKVTGVGVGNDDAVWKLAIQPDGKIVVAGDCLVATRKEFCLARLNENGSLDTSFTGPLGTAAGKFSYAHGSGDSYGFGLALQADGKIVVAGSCPSGTNEDACVIRFNANGSIDTTFGGANGAAPGTYVSGLNTVRDLFYDVVVDSDGKIVAGGFCEKPDSNPVRTDFCVTRLTDTGLLDISFGERSAPAPAPRTGTARVSIGGKEDLLFSLAIQSDGNIVAVGDCKDAAENSQVCVARLSGNNGSIDSSFLSPNAMSSGKFFLGVGAKGTGYVVRVQPDDKIVIAGGCFENLTTTEAFCFARLNANGGYDTTFNGPLGDGAGRFLLPIVPRDRIDDFANGLAIQADGKFVVAGQCDITVSNATQTSACLARMNSDGSLDATFDGTLPTVGNGKFLVPMATGSNKFEPIALQADGKIVAAGRCDDGTGSVMCVARFHGNNPAQTCSLDIDGDGNTTATIDGLIATRVMLGFTNDAVIGSIMFPSNAKRKTWIDIRRFLVNQCGVTTLP
jgi:uncharacterized delta-60 repeat protein